MNNRERHGTKWSIGLPRWAGGSGILHRGDKWSPGLATIPLIEATHVREVDLSPAAVLADNQSTLAQRNINRHEYRAQSHRTLFIVCSDGRVVVPLLIVPDEIDTVGGVLPAWLPKYVEKFHPEDIVVVDHKPCGGHGEKAKQLVEPTPPESRERSAKWVAEMVPTGEPEETGRVLSSLLQEAFPGIPHQVVVEDQAVLRTDEVSRYLPEIDTTDAKAVDKRRETESRFKAVLSELNKDTRMGSVVEAATSVPGFFEAMKVNNPSVVFITNQQQGIRWQGVQVLNQSRFPGTLGSRPGMCFTVSYPSESLVGKEDQEKYLDQAADQIHYAFSHAIASRKVEDPTLPFGRLSYLYIEGETPEELLRAFEAVYRDDTGIGEWSTLPGTNINFLLSQNGQVQRTLSVPDILRFKETGTLASAEQPS